MLPPPPPPPPPLSHDRRVTPASNPHPQTATLLVLNACLVGCILVCVSLLLVPAGLPSELVPHIVGLLLLAAALAFSVNW